MPKWFGAYFVSYDEIVQIFQDAGGTLSDAAIRQKMHAERQARRAIFNYIMPGTIRVNVNLLDEVGGFTFIIGPDDVEYEDIDKELLDRCEDMFLGELDRFMFTDDPYEFTLERDGKTHVLEYVDYVETNEAADWYYWHQYQEAVKAQKARAAEAKTEAEAASTGA